MTDESALLAAIHADPRSDLPRLVYADWLDDHGEADYAEFIRLQCHTAARYGALASKRASQRERSLLRQHGAKWRGGTERRDSIDWDGHIKIRAFQRGLPSAGVGDLCLEANLVGGFKYVDFHLPFNYQLHLTLLVQHGRRECMPIAEALSTPMAERAGSLHIIRSSGEPGKSLPIPTELVIAASERLRSMPITSVEFRALTEAALGVVRREISPYVPTITPTDRS